MDIPFPTILSVALREEGEKMEQNEITHEQSHSIGYGTYVLIWLVLLSLTSITVSIAGIDLGKFTLFAAMLIAAIKSSLVINIFMHIKYDNKIYKAFLVVTAFILLVVFLLTGFDVFFR
jgi:cytochrome c oxidase subunit 4